MFDKIFHNAPENNNLQNLFKRKSSVIPSRNKYLDLDRLVDILNNLDLEGIDVRSKSNLSKMEYSETH